MIRNVLLGALGATLALGVGDATADPTLPELQRASMDSASAALSLSRTRARLSQAVSPPDSVLDTESARNAIYERQSSSVSATGLYSGQQILSSTPDCVIAINYASNADNVTQIANIGHATLTCISD